MKNKEGSKKKGYQLLQEKVPEFGSPPKAVGIAVVWVLLFLAFIVFFLWFDRLVWYGALLSQLVTALICTLLSYAHIKNASRYREKYEQLAYRLFFFRFIMPIFATWYACLIHPLFVGGPGLLPFWLAIVLGCLLFSVRPLTAWHVHRSGFDNVGHGLGIYTVFPEEGTQISSEIYSYIRHPIYLGSFCAALAFAFFRNNLLALFTALIFLIPVVMEVRFEDQEMAERFGERHREYIANTGAVLPRKNIRKFLGILFFARRK